MPQHLPDSMQLFTCPSEKLRHPRLTVVACGKRYGEARHLNGNASAEKVLAYGPCKGCEIGRSHAKGKLHPKAECVSVAAHGTPGRPPPRPSARQSERRQASTLSERTCALESCRKTFKPSRRNQKFCPGGKCTMEYHRGAGASARGRYGAKPKASARKREPATARKPSKKGSPLEGLPPAVIQAGDLLYGAGYGVQAMQVLGGFVLFVEVRGGS